MSNYDIIKAVYSADRTGELARCAIIYNDRVEKGNPSFKGLERYRDIFLLLMNLNNNNYKMTARDQKILKSYNVLLPQQSENHQNITKPKNGSFVATSDFHGIEYPLEKIKKNYINEYDVVYILGDATDRGKDGNGTGGIKLLIDIMKLSKQYPDKIIYVPGNHDEFLLGYIRSKYHMDEYYQYDYATNLAGNGGISTILELNKLESNDPETFNELISWLGKQPMQRIHRFDGVDYVLAHAQFNQKLYDFKPNYSLEDYFKEPQLSDTRRMAHEVLWFRKIKRDHNSGKNKPSYYNPSEMPTADKIMIIGHTPPDSRIVSNLNLIDRNGREIQVHCVDGGIPYEKGGMLKYDGKGSARWTTKLPHIDTSKQINSPTKTSIDYEAIFKKFIINKTLSEGRSGALKLINGITPQGISPNEFIRIIDKSIELKTTKDIQIKRNIYIKTVLFDHILKSQIERMQEQYKDKNYAIYAASEMINIFLRGTNNKEYIQTNGHNGKNDYYNITSKNKAREIARVIGPQIMEEILYIYNCNSIEEYIYNKIIKDNTKNKKKNTNP